jgi:mRNA interferase MazF
VSHDYVPDRGELIWIDFDPGKGHEQSGRRPAVVVSPQSYNRKVGLVLLCPITSRKKGYPFEVALPEGLPVVGVILTDQIKSFDWRVRNAELACVLPLDFIDGILHRVRLLLT